MRAERAAQHAVGVAAMDHHRADQRVAAAHLDLRVRLRHALALRSAGSTRSSSRDNAVVVIGIDHLEVVARLEPQAEALDARLDAPPAGRRASAARASRRRPPAPRAARARPRLRRTRCASAPPSPPSKIGFISKPGVIDELRQPLRDRRRSRRSAASRRPSPSPPSRPRARSSR